MIGIVTATYKKPTLELFCYSINALRNVTQEPIHCICVGDKEDKKICDEYNIEFIYHPNTFVSDKFNKAMEGMRRHNPSNVLILGSDDIISVDTLAWYIKHKEYDLISVEILYVYNVNTSEMIKLYLENIGAGRMYHHNILDKHQWRIWPDGLKRNLDQNSYRYVANDIKTHIKTKGFLLDIKTDNNITPWDRLIALPEAVRVNEDILKEHLSEGQIKLLEGI